MTLTPRAKAATAVIAAGVLWGISAVVAKAAFNARVDPLDLVQARVILAGVFLLGVSFRRTREAKLEEAPWKGMALWALFGLLPMQAGYFVAVSRCGVATAIFVQYTAPVLTALYAFVRGERLGLSIVGALGLCLSGLAALMLGGGDKLQWDALGIAAALFAACAMAFNAVYARRILAVLPAPTALGLGMLLAFVYTCSFRNPAHTLAALVPSHASEALFIGVVATAVPFLLYLWGLARLPPTTAILLAMVEPVVGALGAWLALGEVLAPAQVAGSALILVGVALAERRPSEAPAIASA